MTVAGDPDGTSPAAALLRLAADMDAEEAQWLRIGEHGQAGRAKVLAQTFRVQAQDEQRLKDDRGPRRTRRADVVDWLDEEERRLELTARWVMIVVGPLLIAAIVWFVLR